MKEAVSLITDFFPLTFYHKIFIHYEKQQLNELYKNCTPIYLQLGFCNILLYLLSTCYLLIRLIFQLQTSVNFTLKYLKVHIIN